MMGDRNFKSLQPILRLINVAATVGSLAVERKEMQPEEISFAEVVWVPMGQCGTPGARDWSLRVDKSPKTRHGRRLRRLRRRTRSAHQFHVKTDKTCL
jgi:hypothetical protein